MVESPEIEQEHLTRSKSENKPNSGHHQKKRAKVCRIAMDGNYALGDLVNDKATTVPILPWLPMNLSEKFSTPF